jgi:adenosylcobinamide-GDP ribazoletransferase
MKGLLSAITFLTVMPAGRRHQSGADMPRAVPYFPAIGALIGLACGSCAVVMISLGFNPIAASATAVVALVIVTGGLHLDGLADTFDALLSGKPKDEMLRIMRDPHIGTMGVLSIASVMVLKISLLSCLGARSMIPAVVFMCAAGRWSCVMLMASFPYARPDGKARQFIAGANYGSLTAATIIMTAVSFVLYRTGGVIVLVSAAIPAYLFGKAVSSKLGGITGDTLGAACELVEVVSLFGACMLKATF